MQNKDIRLIQSFTIDHDILDPGIYISRRDGDVVTYDLRTRRPNSGDYMDNVTMHTFEHMFATYVRNSEHSDNVIYFGPMGCRTGFYLLVRGMEPMEVLSLVKQTLGKILAHEGPVFGAKRKECGNYRSLKLSAAKAECRRYLDILTAMGTPDFKYKEQ